MDDGAPVDALLEGLSQAQVNGQWQVDTLSEGRRRALLPQVAPLPWDELMHHAPYLHALERLQG